MSRYISFRDFDWVLLIFVLLICGLGVMEIQSATVHTKFAGAHIKQVYWVLGGLGGMFLVSFINYQVLLDRVHWLYFAYSGIVFASCILFRAVASRRASQSRGRSVVVGSEPVAVSHSET